MTTKFCLLILFAASVSCAPSEIATEKKDDAEFVKPIPLSDKSNGYNILPIYEIRSVPASHSSLCSPNCHKKLYDRPVYLVMKSDTPKEFEVHYFKEGLKEYRPRDKVKLFNVLGKAVGIVFSKYDFPVDNYPNVIKDTKDSDVPEDVPYFVVTNEERLAEIYRDKKYDKVAEMEVSSDGLITRIVVTHRAVVEVEVVVKPKDEIVDKPKDMIIEKPKQGTANKPNGRKIEETVKEENALTRDANVRLSLYELLRYLASRPSYQSNIEYSQHHPLYTQSSIDDFMKYYSSRPLGYDALKYPSKYDTSFFENMFGSNKDKYSAYNVPKYWDTTTFGEEYMNQYPGYSSKHHQPQSQESFKFGYTPKYWHYQPHSQESFKFGYTPKHWYSSPSHDSYDYNPNYFSGGHHLPEYNSAPGYGSNYNSMQGLADYSVPNSWQDEYEQYSPKPFYNNLYYQSEPNSDKYADFYSAGLNHGSNVKYYQNKSHPQIQKFPFSSRPGVPETYSSERVPYLFSPFSPQYTQYHQSDRPYFPSKFHNPGVTYVLNICHGQRPSYVPEIEAASVDHGHISPSYHPAASADQGQIASSVSYHPTKPESVQIIHPTTAIEQSPKVVPALRLSADNVPSSDEFYGDDEPSSSFRNIIYRPNIDESDEFRKITSRPKPHNEKPKRPIHYLYSQPQFSPPPNNVHRPPPNSIPSGFVASSQP